MRSLLGNLVEIAPSEARADVESERFMAEINPHPFGGNLFQQAAKGLQ